MDELIGGLQQLTGKMLSILDEATYEELEAFIEQRQSLIDELIRHTVDSPLSSAQKEEIRRILEEDERFLYRMNELRLEAQEWLQRRNQAKMQRNAYDSGYAADSFLMDRKK